MQLARFADAIGIAVDPDIELTESGILTVDDAVVVGIELSQGSVTVGRFLSVGQRGAGTEQLGAIVDVAITVKIHDQQAVTTANPAGIRLAAGIVDVELHAGAQAQGLDTVAIQIQYEWRVDREVRQGADIRCRDRVELVTGQGEFLWTTRRAAAASSGAQSGPSSAPGSGSSSSRRW